MAAAIFLTAGAGTYEGISLTSQRSEENSYRIAVSNEKIAAELENIPAPKISEPLSASRERINKKPFGIKVTPKSSPIKAERFTGYHTGVDLEILAGEEDVDVPVKALCDGKLLIKEIGSGYGGIMSQSCLLDGKNVTVIYGHLNLSSITKNQGDKISSGEQIAVLGKGFSEETDKERKHLHLGIHLGRGLDLRGYVATEQELKGWLDPLKFLP